MDRARERSVDGTARASRRGNDASRAVRHSRERCARPSCAGRGRRAAPSSVGRARRSRCRRSPPRPSSSPRRLDGASGRTGRTHGRNPARPRGSRGGPNRREPPSRSPPPRATRRSARSRTGSDRPSSAPPSPSDSSPRTSRRAKGRSTTRGRGRPRSARISPPGGRGGVTWVARIRSTRGDPRAACRARSGGCSVSPRTAPRGPRPLLPRTRPRRRGRSRRGSTGAPRALLGLE